VASEFCPKGICDGSGFVLGEDGVARPCECREARVNRAKGRRLGSGIPKRFRGVSFERRPICAMHPEVVARVRRFVHRIDRNLDEGRGLWFYGDVGTGKTSLAMLVSKAALDAGRSVAIYSVPRLLVDIKKTYDEGNSGSAYADLLRRLSDVDLLHLDDLGSERSSEWVLEQLYSIVDERWQSERSIVVTTNLIELDDVRRQVGARTVSRLTEICGELIPIMGADLRMPVSS
jgi:DNA replication protein DnaC